MSGAGLEQFEQTRCRKCNSEARSLVYGGPGGRLSHAYFTCEGFVDFHALGGLLAERCGQESKSGASEWQLIDGAPKDGTRILAWSEQEGVVTVKWAYREWQLDPDGGTEFHYEFGLPLTHWRPLPDGPQ